jgi:hypothetical protein
MCAKGTKRSLLIRGASAARPRRSVMSKQEKLVPCYFAVLIGAALFYTQAVHAEYRCDSPKTEIDHVACQKAKEGPAALRHYIQRMRAIESLYFFDYVNEERLIAWRDMERKTEPTPQEKQARSD